jgi:uncharacterized protein (DUF983 family)
MANINPETVLAVEYYEGTDGLLRVVCKLCGQVLYDHAAGDAGQPALILVAISAHLELAHGFMVEAHMCEDPACREDGSKL